MTDWLVDTLLATSALLLLVLLLRGFVARSFGPSVAYWLWLLPAARLFMPALTKEVAAPATAPVSDIFRDAAAAAPVMTSEPVMAATASINWTGIGLSVWLGGAALLFIVQMIRYVALRDELLADANEIDVIDDIRVVESDRIGGPLAFGLFKRYIAVPDHFTRTFSDEERDLALAHELAHHRAGDLYANLAAFSFLCLQWFNPLAWMAWSAFRFDQEAACDARVLAGTDVGTRQNYGRALARAASSDRMPALAMAMAQNRPHSIIERLRRLMMKDTSKGRLWTGRVAIFAAVAIALPLTATVVPVFAEDKMAEDAKTGEHKTKIIIVKDGDGKTTQVDVSGDTETPFVRTIQKDGKTIVLRTNKELSEAEVEKIVAEAEASRAEAEAEWGDAEAARTEAEAAREDAATRGQANREDAAAQAEANGNRTSVIKVRRHDGKDMAWTIDGEMMAAYIPEIDISEVRTNCKDGHPVSTDVSGFDGHNKSRVRVVMCGKGQAKLVRMEAIKGLREAREEMKRDKDIPDNVRQSVLDSLEKQIDRMENQISEEDEPDNEA